MLIFCFYVLAPSFEQIQKFTGNAGVAIYVILGIAAMYCLRKYFLLPLDKMLTRKTAWVLAISAFALICVLFIAIYPYANAGFRLGGKIIGGRGDRDDAINLAVRAMLHGLYPYHEQLFTGNPITPLPGAFILGAPFVVVFGNSAYQNLFWLAAFFVVLNRFIFKNTVQSFLFLAVLFVLSPVLMQEIVSGSDFISNTIYIFIFSLLFIHYTSEEGGSTFIKIAVSVALGLMFSSRVTFTLIFPVIAVYVSRRAGIRSALLYGLVVIITFALITLPFYFADPSGFTPLTVYAKAGKFEDTVPYAGLIIVIMSVCIAVVAAIYKPPENIRALCKRCAITQMFPVFGTIVVSMIGNGNFSLKYYGGYAVAFMLFGAVGYWQEFAGISKFAEARSA